MEKEQGRIDMRKYFSLFFVLFLVMVASGYCFAENLELSGIVEQGIRIIDIKASRYKFEPDPIVVKVGEKVRLVVTSTDVAHGLAISEFKVNLSVSAGKTESIEFVAGKKGIFHAYCSVYCGSGHGHMQGRFVVK
jgi:heme/copper-type cytochrome/quinol oxidase subunit 2